MAQGLALEPEVRLRSIDVAPRFRSFLPAQVDLSAGMPEPGNQGPQGSCVAWSVGYGLRGYYARAMGYAADISPSFIYNQINPKRGECTTGTYISDGLDLLKNVGAVPLSSFPYDVDDCSRLPAPDLISTASYFRIESYRRLDIDKIDDVKGELARRHPVVFGMSISERFLTLKAGEVYAPRPDDADKFGHAMVIVGYDESKQAFKFMNSWGRHWGDDGFGWITYDAFKAKTSRAFSMRPAAPPPPSSRPEPAPIAVIARVIEPPPSPPQPVVVPIPSPARDIPPTPRPDPVVVVPQPEPAPITVIGRVVEPPPSPPQPVVVPIPSPARDVPPIPQPDPVVVVPRIEPVVPPTPTVIPTPRVTPSDPPTPQVVEQRQDPPPQPQPPARDEPPRPGPGTVVVIPRVEPATPPTPTVIPTPRVTPSDPPGPQTVERRLDPSPRQTPAVGERPAPRLGAPQLAAQIASVLRETECASASATSTGATVLRLAGFVPSESIRREVNALVERRAANVRVEGALAVRPWPVCEVLQTFESPLTQPQGLQVSVKTVDGAEAGATLREGDRFRVEVTAPDFPAYIYVTYIQANGDAVHLAKPTGRVPTPTRPRETLVFGGDSARTFRVTAPFGEEVVIAVAAASPLLPWNTPQTQFERDYLTEIRASLVYRPPNAAPQDRRRVAAMARIVNTEPAK
jgi:hypothetical protein